MLIQNEFLRLTPSESGLILSPKKGKPSVSITIILPETIQDTRASKIEDRLWGQGHRLTLNQTGNKSTTITLYERTPFAHLETHVSNPGNEPRDLRKLDIAELTFDRGVDGDNLNTLGTPGLRPVSEESNSYAYITLVDPKSRRGVVTGWLTQRQGVGILLSSLKEGQPRLRTFLDFGHYRVKPNQTRETDVLAIGFFEDARLGLEHYAEDTARVYAIKLPPKPNVYNTWYHQSIHKSGCSNQKRLTENATFAAQHLKPFGLGVMQIDDHWQSESTKELPYRAPQGSHEGPVKLFVEARADRFPDGMAAMASILRKKGFTPGIWFIPFAGTPSNPNLDPDIFVRNRKTGGLLVGQTWSGTCIDLTNPKGEAFLRQRFKRLHDWGYRYFKLDGLHTGAPSRNIYVHREFKGETFADNAELHNKDMTFVQAFRHGLDIVREEAPETFCLGCCVVQNMVSFAPAFGKVDAMRVGPDNDDAASGHWESVLMLPMFAGNYYFLHNRVWYNDPDPVYVRETAPLSHVQCMLSFVAVTGMMHSTSMQYAELSPKRLNLIKRSLPSHDLNVRPVDILEKEIPSLWLVRNDRLAVLGVFNWEVRDDAVIKESLERIGLDAKKRYHAYEFWSDSYLGIIQEELCVSLRKTSCQVLALREVMNHPQVISTSRHITQGLMDVASEKWDPETNVLRGVSKVIADDPYELRIVCPAGFQLTAMPPDLRTKVSLVTQENGVARVRILPTATGSLDWTLTFKDEGAN